MLKLVTAALAAIFTIMYVYGDPERAPEVSRSEPSGLTLAAFANLSEPDESPDTIQTTTLSESDAVQLALAAGKTHRLTRAEAPRFVASVNLTDNTKPVSTAVEPAPVYWLVSGTRVNVRQGPGTDNAVVGQVTKGMEAEVLDTRDGWMQIVTRDGVATGWISGQFLKEQRPG